MSIALPKKVRTFYLPIKVFPKSQKVQELRESDSVQYLTTPNYIPDNPSLVLFAYINER